MVIAYHLFIAMEVWGIVFAATISFCMYINKSKESESEHWMYWVLVSTAILLTADVIGWTLDGSSREGAYDILIISDFVAYMMGYVLLALFTKYITSFVEGNVLTKLINLTVGFGFCITIANQFTHFMYYVDDANVYHRGSWFFLSQGTGIVGTVWLAMFLLQKRRELGIRRFIALFTYILLPSLAMIIQIFYYGMPLLNISIAISVIMNFAVMLVNQNRALTQQKKEILHRDQKLEEERERVNDMKIRLVLSQVRPHFLYNALNSIYYLIDKSPEQAQAAIDSFSDYLRGNMAALESQELIPFTQEMKHVKSYLRLEEMRFPDELEVIYDIDVLNFNVPALSVEPIVENAVKHGVSQKPDGGYVRIVTRELETGFIIQVEDNGVGFDPDRVGEDNKLHVGLANVRMRIESMAKGTMTVKSEIGVGTRVEIFLPKDFEIPKLKDGDSALHL